MTDETIKQLDHEIRMQGISDDVVVKRLINNVFTPAIREEILKEREACAKIAEQHNQQGPYIATHIRARGKK